MIKRDIRYVIKKILIGVGIIFVMSFIKSCNVSAKSYSIENNNTRINMYGTYVNNIEWNTNYSRSNAYEQYTGFDSKVELISTTDTPVLFEGRYLVSFIVWSNQNQQEINCSNITSNFKNVNTITGNWVQNEIKSQCLDLYNVTYSGHKAIRLLYEFTYKSSNASDGITEIEFIVTTNSGYKFFQGNSNGLDIGFTISDIMDYDLNIINTWNTDKSQQTIINGQQDMINNQINNTNSIIYNQDSNTQDMINNQNQNTQEVIDNQNELLGNLCDNLINVNNFVSTTLNGITFTNNNNGTITINGTATQDFGLSFATLSLSAGTYTLNNSVIPFYLYNYNNNTSVIGSGSTQTISNDISNVGVDIWFTNNSTYNNIIFKPMLSLSSSEQPFCKYGTYNSKIDSMIESQNQNKQDIINNQNQNTQDILDSQKVCTNGTIGNNDIKTEHSILSGNGSITTASSSSHWVYSYGVTDFIRVTQINILDSSFAVNLCFYNDSKSLISCSTYSSLGTGIKVLPQNTEYIRATVHNSRPQLIRYQSCQNGNQAMNDSINETNDTLKDNTIDDPSGEFEDFKGMLAENGVITELITLPISLFTNILNSINGTCSVFVLGELMGTNLTIPCINISDYLGSFLWNVIDILFSGIFVYTISKKMIQVFENMTSMRESDDLA